MVRVQAAARAASHLAAAKQQAKKKEVTASPAKPRAQAQNLRSPGRTGGFGRNNLAGRLGGGGEGLPAVSLRVSLI